MVDAEAWTKAGALSAVVIASVPNLVDPDAADSINGLAALIENGKMFACTFTARVGPLAGLMVIVPDARPTGSVPVFGVTVIVLEKTFAVPLAGLTDTQEGKLVMLKLTDEPSVLVRDKVCAAGLARP